METDAGDKPWTIRSHAQRRPGGCAGGVFRGGRAASVRSVRGALALCVPRPRCSGVRRQSRLCGRARAAQRRRARRLARVIVADGRPQPGLFGRCGLAAGAAGWSSGESCTTWCAVVSLRPGRGSVGTEQPSAGLSLSAGKHGACGCALAGRTSPVAWSRIGVGPLVLA